MFEINRETPKPKEDLPLESFKGNVVKTWDGEFDPNQSTSAKAKALLEQGWSIKVKNISGGTFVHFTTPQARQLRAWGVYNAVTVTKYPNGGISERGNVILLTDEEENSLKFQKIKRDIGTAELFRPHNQSLFSTSERFMEFAKAHYNKTDAGLFQKPEITPEMIEFIMGKIRRFTMTIDPTVMVEEVQNGRLVTLRYLEASPPFPNKRYYKPKV